jgi:hypothetical protein
MKQLEVSGPFHSLSAGVMDAQVFHGLFFASTFILQQTVKPLVRHS